MLNNNSQNIAPISMNLQQKARDRQVFEQFLNKKTFVNADKPSGRLVKENIIQQFGSTFSDTAKDIGNLGRALTKGESNDHSLGRMNDLGMKLGGGLIAAALMGNRATTNKKLMEVAGFATFFSAMSLWPKVAIDLPTKLMHGFNPHQKYIDSQGRKKPFFLDNQYLPWDIWSKEEIDKIADKMGVPKDIKDREEYTREKMRTIALQDNTLWMLTAGLAAPLLTSITCNKIENAIRVPVANAELKNLAKENISEAMTGKILGDAKLFTKQDELMAEILSTLRKGEMPEDFAAKIGNVFNIANVVDNQEVSDKLTKKAPTLANEFIAKLFPATGSFSEGAFIEALVGDEGQEALEEAKGLFRKAAEMSGSNAGIEEIINNVNNIIDADPDAYINKRWTEAIADGFDGLSDNLKKLGKTSAGYDKDVLASGADILENIYNNGVKPAQASARTYGRQIKKLNGVSGEKYNRTAQTLLKALNLDKNDIKMLRNNERAFSDVIQTIFAEKLGIIANDDEQYKKVMEMLGKEEARIEKISKGEKTISIKVVFDSLTNSFNNAVKKAGSVFDGTPVEDTGIAKLFKQGVSKQEAQAARSNVTAVDSMISRMKAALELERRISDGSLIEKWTENVNKYNYQGAMRTLDEESVKDFYQICRRCLWQSSYGDVMNKNYITGNGDFFKALSDTIFDNASTNEKDWCKAAKALLESSVFIPNPNLETGAKTLIDNEYANLKGSYCKANGVDWCEFETRLPEIAKQFREKAIEKAGCGEVYGEEIFKTHNLKFADLGESVLNTLKKQVNQMYNDKNVWMKVFGGATAALIGVTLISQLFFGKVKNSECYERITPQNGNDTFESGK